MDMKRKTLMLGAFLLIAFGALRLYGAYEGERDNAIKRAMIAEQRSSDLNEEATKLRHQSDCNRLWMTYETAELNSEFADLRGTAAVRPTEPPCTGHVENLDEAFGLISQNFEASSAATDAATYTKFERRYSQSARYQTRYLCMRLWAFLIGAGPRVKPAEMVREIENSESLRECVKRAGTDSLRKTCQDLFGQPSPAL